MADLLETIIEAHGGLDRWQRLDAVSVHGANGRSHEPAITGKATER
jgi:hypothetical protein